MTESVPKSTTLRLPNQPWIQTWAWVWAFLVGLGYMGLGLYIGKDMSIVIGLGIVMGMTRGMGIDTGTNLEAHAWRRSIRVHRTLAKGRSMTILCKILSYPILFSTFSSFGYCMAALWLTDADPELEKGYDEGGQQCVDAYKFPPVMRKHKLGAEKNTK